MFTIFRSFRRINRAEDLKDNAQYLVRYKDILQWYILVNFRKRCNFDDFAEIYELPSDRAVQPMVNCNYDTRTRNAA